MTAIIAKVSVRPPGHRSEDSHLYVYGQNLSRIAPAAERVAGWFAGGALAAVSETANAPMGRRAAPEMLNITGKSLDRTAPTRRHGEG